MNTAGAIAQALARAGIKKVFGLPGGEVLVLSLSDGVFKLRPA